MRCKLDPKKIQLRFTMNYIPGKLRYVNFQIFTSCFRRNPLVGALVTDIFSEIIPLQLERKQLRVTGVKLIFKSCSSPFGTRPIMQGKLFKMRKSEQLKSH